MESQSQTGRALAYKLGGFESTASLRIAYSLPNTKAATYLAVLQLGFTTVSIDRRDLPAVRQCPTLEDLKTLHAGFFMSILRGDSALIPVKSAGKMLEIARQISDLQAEYNRLEEKEQRRALYACLKGVRDRAVRRYFR